MLLKISKGQRAVLRWQLYVAVTLSRLSTPPLVELWSRIICGFMSSLVVRDTSVCTVLITRTFLFLFGQYETTVAFSVKTNIEECRGLPCIFRISLGSSGLFLLTSQHSQLSLLKFISKAVGCKEVCDLAALHSSPAPHAFP